MKSQHFLSVLALIFVCSITQAQVPLVPMVELFTNASCDECATQQSKYNEIMNPHEKEIVQLEYHYVPDTAVDILAEQENNIPKRRKNFYEQKIQEIPAVVIGGNVWPGKFGAPKDLKASMMTDAIALTSLISLEVSHTINVAKDSVFVTINLANDTEERFLGKDVFVYVALIEKVIEFDAPIGTNGQKVFRNVVRKMLPSYTGKKISRNILSGRKLDFSFSSSIPDYLYDLNKMGVVAWIQHSKQKVVYQCGESEPIDFTGTTDVKEFAQIDISPNPVIDQLNIEVVLKSHQNIDISLINMAGKKLDKIWSGDTQVKQILWPTSHLDAGLYIVRLKAGDRILNKKIVVQ